ncbi:major facilitator superfamily domain-containing protein [Podospora appendiculata]|uniref:Major facilitator superfamily domain-containing protein n=1 Tax=Podospora appendiculata TaxID=314037 RepID=A0AAE0X8Q9_9PEZI|nr:major facilitator superfamily domain-containing protein [Podospora appendiculata]
MPETGTSESDTVTTLHEGYEKDDDNDNSDNTDNNERAAIPPGRYLTGTRLFLVCTSLCICIFLPTVEIAIVSTSLVTISADLSGFDKSNWLVTAYLSAFTGFLLIWAKIGHHIGLKMALLASLVLFMAFSAGCGASRSINELIVFRALQGIGGAGTMALPSTAFFQIVPMSGYSKMNALLSCTLAIALVVSPLMGGGLSNGNHWRWVFYLNLPIGAVALALLALALPNRFPHHLDPKPGLGAARRHTGSLVGKFLWEADVFGAFLLLGTVVFLVAALEEGGTVDYGWDSGFIVASFVVSGSLLAAFFLWQWWAGRETTAAVPSFPRSFTHNRVLPAGLLGAFLVGAPMTISSIQLPQRYQLVNEMSPLDAGVKFLAYGVPFPFGVVVTSVLAGRFRLPFVYIIVLGTVMQIVGFALLSTTPGTVDPWPGQFGYSFIAGLGVGITGGLYNFLVPLSINKKEQYLAIGAGVQARMLGGSVGIAVVNSVWVNYVRRQLESTLAAGDIDTLLVDIGSLGRFPPAVQETFRAVCSDGYNLQMLATLGFAAAQLIVVAALWRRPAYRLSKEGALM